RCRPGSRNESTEGPPVDTSSLFGAKRRKQTRKPAKPSGVATVAASTGVFGRGFRRVLKPAQTRKPAANGLTPGAFLLAALTRAVPSSITERGAVDGGAG